MNMKMVIWMMLMGKMGTVCHTAIAEWWKVNQIHPPRNIFVCNIEYALCIYTHYTLSHCIITLFGGSIVKKAISLRRLAKCQNIHLSHGEYALRTAWREALCKCVALGVCCMLLSFKVMPFVPITWFHYIFYNPLVFVVLATFVCFEIFFYWLNLSYYIVMMINFTHYI